MAKKMHTYYLEEEVVKHITRYAERRNINKSEALNELISKSMNADVVIAKQIQQLAEQLIKGDYNVIQKNV